MKETIKKIVMAFAKGVDENYEITNEAHLIDDLNMDSIELIQLLVSLEEEFDIEFDTDELDINSIMQFGNLVNIVEEYMG